MSKIFSCFLFILFPLFNPTLGGWSKALVKREVCAAGAYVFKAVHYSLHRSGPEQFNVRYKGVHQLYTDVEYWCYFLDGRFNMRMSTFVRTVEKMDTPSIETCGANPAIGTVPVTGGLICDHNDKKEMTVKGFSYKTCNDSEGMIGFTEYYKTIPVVKRALCSPNEYEDYPLHRYPTLGMEGMDPEDYGPDGEPYTGKKVFCKTWETTERIVVRHPVCKPLVLSSDCQPFESKQLLIQLDNKNGPEDFRVVTPLYIGVSMGIVLATNEKRELEAAIHLHEAHLGRNIFNPYKIPFKGSLQTLNKLGKSQILTIKNEGDDEGEPYQWNEPRNRDIFEPQRLLKYVILKITKGENVSDYQMVFSCAHFHSKGLFLPSHTPNEFEMDSRNLTTTEAPDY